MQTPTQTTENTAQTTTEAPLTREPTFTEFEALRRSGKPVQVTSVEQSAPAKEKSKPEQKSASESGNEEAEAKQAADEDEGDLDEESEKPESGKTKKDGGWQRRIKKLTAQREEERRHRQTLEARLAQLEARTTGDKTSEASKATASGNDGEPDAGKFETHAEYVKAVASWEYDQRKKADQAEAEKQKLISEHQTIQQKYQERLKSFTEKHEDYFDALEEVSDIVVPTHLHVLVMESENGPALVYELAKNKAELEKISKLSPTSAALAIGRLEAKIDARTASASEDKKPEPKKLTQAPKPLEPVGKSAATVRQSIHDEGIPFQDFERLRREQMRRKRG